MASKSIADRLQAAGFDAGRGSITMCDPEALTVITDKAHPLYDPRIEDPLDEDLIASIMSIGVQQAIVCRSNGEEAGVPIFQVVDGRRRRMHAVEANRRLEKEGKTQLRVPMITITGSDLEMLKVGTSLNLDRKSESFRSLAWKARTMKTLGATDAEIARAFHCSGSKLSLLLAYWNLIPAAQKAIDEGTLPFGAIDGLIAVPREKQEDLLKTLKENGATKTHEITDIIEAKANGKPVKPVERKRSWGRREFKAMRLNLEEAGPNHKEARLAKALLDFFMNGDKTGLREFDWLELSVKETTKYLAKKTKKSDEKESAA